MTPQEEVEAMLADAKKGATVTQATPDRVLTNPPGEMTSLARGAGSGLLMGFQPQVAGALTTGFGTLGDYKKSVEESKQANQDAWNAHPGLYGTGYAAGTAAGMYGPGALVKGGKMAAEAIGAARATSSNANIASKVVAIMDAAEAAGQPITYAQAQAAAQAAVGSTAKVVPTVTAPTLQGTANAIVKPFSSIPAAAGTATKRLVPSLIGEDTNTPLTGMPLSYATPEDNKQQVAQIDTKAQVPANKFGTLIDWLAQAQNSNNPAVQEQARQTAEATAQDPDNQDLNRLLAMKLQESQAGRAVGNEDSPINQA